MAASAAANATATRFPLTRPLALDAYAAPSVSPFGRREPARPLSLPCQFDLTQPHLSEGVMPPFAHTHRMKDYRVPTVNESVSERPQAPGGSMMHERDAEPPETIMTPDGRLAEILEEISAQVYGVHAIVIGGRNGDGDACHDGRRQDHPKPLPPESGRHHDPCRLVERRDHELGEGCTLAA